MTALPTLAEGLGETSPWHLRGGRAGTEQAWNTCTRSREQLPISGRCRSYGTSTCIHGHGHRPGPGNRTAVQVGDCRGRSDPDHLVALICHGLALSAVLPRKEPVRTLGGPREVTHSVPCAEPVACVEPPTQLCRHGSGAQNQHPEVPSPRYTAVRTTTFWLPSFWFVKGVLGPPRSCELLLGGDPTGADKPRGLGR